MNADVSLCLQSQMHRATGCSALTSGLGRGRRWIKFSFIATWTYSCFKFQTWLLIDGERRIQLSSLVANLILFGGLVVGGGSTLGLAIYGRTVNIQFNADCSPFSQNILSELGPLVGAYGAASAKFFTKLPTLLYIFAVSPLPVTLINLSAVFLWLILRRQGQRNREMDALAAPGANTDTSGGSEGCLATSQRRKEMKAIEHGFLVDAVGVFMFSCGVLVTDVWTAVTFQHIRTAGWSSTEASFFLPSWSASVSLAIAMIIQVILAWRGLPPPRQASAEGSDAPRDSQPRPREEMIGVGVHQVGFGSSSDREKTTRQELLEKEGREEDERKE
ncbi:hypothetical protein BCR35DRAFT_335836 [Leucosporidium creatinivorum]|uniref:Uncharacterized protein n=1 Tax=Leucosporidium creatinivorum TaxID=106004 RepID=A0A1Y2D4E1_9BASI|nr:hypothetical protein BCR35DRAFT_335836 [Leucosporidium creatinivorum]